MPQEWLDGWEFVDSDHGSGGTYVDGPWRFVVHTVEADPTRVDDCRNAARSNPYPPQLWYSPTTGWKGQTIPLSRSGFALEHPSGTAETNKMRAIQLEVFGFARDAGGWPASTLDGIGEIVRQVIDAGYPLNLAHVAPTTGSDGYGTGGTVRFNDAHWAQFDGLCCHSNVPQNVHWDAGAINLAAIAQAARPHQEDDMPKATYIRVKSSGQVYLAGLTTPPRAVKSYADSEYHREREGIELLPPPQDATEMNQDGQGRIEPVMLVDDGTLFGL